MIRPLASRHHAILLTIVLSAPFVTSLGVANPRNPEGEAEFSTLDRSWIPGVSFIAGAMLHERQGDISSIERGWEDGDSRVPIAFLGIGGELSSPTLVRRFGSPRLLAHGDLTWALDTDEGLVNQDEPGRPTVPPIANFPVLGVSGQGQGLRVESSPLVLSAGVGVSFSVRAADRRFRIKPSLDWIWQRDKLTTRFGHAESEGSNPDFCQPCRIVQIDASQERDFHSLGPGLEVEMDAGRTREILWSLFARVNAYRLLSDSRVVIRERGSWTTNGSPSADRGPTTVVARYQREDWSYRFAVGLRLLWQPEK